MLQCPSPEMAHLRRFRRRNELVRLVRYFGHARVTASIPLGDPGRVETPKGRSRRGIMFYDGAVSASSLTMQTAPMMRAGRCRTGSQPATSRQVPRLDR